MRQIPIEIKCRNPYFKQIWADKKKFEIRLNDRNYRVGKLILLHEYSISKEFSNRSILIEITSILKIHNGLKPNYIIFSFIILDKIINTQ